MKIDGLVWVDAGLLFPGREDGSESGGKWEYAFGNKSRTGSHLVLPTNRLHDGVLGRSRRKIWFHSAAPPQPTPTKFPISNEIFCKVLAPAETTSNERKMRLGEAGLAWKRVRNHITSLRIRYPHMSPPLRPCSGPRLR